MQNSFAFAIKEATTFDFHQQSVKTESEAVANAVWYQRRLRRFNSFRAQAMFARLSFSCGKMNVLANPVLVEMQFAVSSSLAVRKRTTAQEFNSKETRNPRNFVRSFYAETNMLAPLV